MNIEKIYTNADGKDVAKYVVYVETDFTGKTIHPTNKLVYADEQLTESLSSNDLRDLFHAGLIVRGCYENKKYTGNIFLPLFFNDRDYVNTDCSSLAIAVPGTSNAVDYVVVYGNEWKES